MHERGIVHLDIKPQNLMVDEGMNLKVVDFGFATNESIDKIDIFQGTKSYIAPEIWLGDIYDGRQTDVFAAGVTIFQIVCGHLPFSKANKDSKSYKIFMSGDLEAYLAYVDAKDLSDEFKDLICGMLCTDPKKRLSIHQVKSHPWMKSQYDQEELKREIFTKLNINEDEEDDTNSTTDTRNSSQDEQEESMETLSLNNEESQES